MTATDAGPWGKQGPASEEEMVTDPNDPDEEFTDEEIAIVRTAMSILPHLGPEATAAYIERASGPDHRGEHEGA